MDIALAGLAAVLLLAFIGIPLGFSMLSVGVAGFALARGWEPAFAVAGQIIVNLSTSHEFSVLPLFVLMGAFVYRAELSDELFDASNAWLGHHRGGLAMATIATCAGFSAVSGSSLATAATMARATIPSMRRYKYSDSLAAGSVAAGGTMGILIPPSVALVLYGILTNSDIGALFIGGILPGILTAVLYMAAVAVVTRINPAAGPRGPRSAWLHRWRTLSRVWGVVALFVFVLGGIYLGVFTPNEAGGMGAVGALAFALFRRKMNLSQFFQALSEAGRTTAMIFTVGFGAIILSAFVTVAGLTGGLQQLLVSLDVGVLGVILLIAVIYLLLGTVFDGLAMILLTVPVFAPVVASFGIDLVWFGIFVVIMAEISLITPPVGLNVFVLRAVMPDLALSTIFRGIVPFFVADIARVVLIVLFPSIVLFLPGMMG